MAVFIGSREAEQCRSHHQKMEKKYHSFPNILLFLRKSHYSTEDTHSIYEDMINNQITEIGTLLSAGELQDIDSQKEMPPSPTIAEIQAEPDREVDLAWVPVIEQNFNISKPFDDFFGDCYEHQLELDNLLL